MIYLKNRLGGNIAMLRDSETKEMNNLLDSGQWYRVNGAKDYTPYVEKKAPKKKPKKVVKKDGE